MQKIKNKNYRQFLDEGIIEPISEEDLKQALNNCDRLTRKAKIGKALLIAMYFTGARPNELLQLKAKDITKQGTHILIKVKGSKGGLPRTIYLKAKNPYILYLYDFACANFDEMFIFHDFRDAYKRVWYNKKGERKERYEISSKLRWHFKQWFGNIRPDGIPPYFLRHNRFSKLSEKGATMEQIRMMKGSKTFESITPYLHMSAEAGKKLSRLNE